MVLRQRHFALGPNILRNLLLTGIVAGIALHQILFGSNRAGDSQLSQELNGPVQTESTVPLVGVEVKFGGILRLRNSL